MKNKSILRIFFFLLVSFIWSYIFFEIRPLKFENSSTPYLLTLLLLWLPPIGLFTMALLLRPQLKSSKKIELTGGSLKWSLLIAIIPALLLAVVGLPNEQGINFNLFGLFIGLLMIVYTLLEEYGWRGYLQQEFNINYPQTNEWLKYIFIGFFWYAWHWSFIDDFNLSNELIICGGLILASAGIGQIADHTNSILVAAAFHSLGNTAFFFGLITSALSFEKRILIVVLCVISWVIIIKKWDREKLLAT